MRARTFSPLVLLLILLGCEIPNIEQIEDTSWTLPVSLITSPDTLFMQELEGTEGYSFNDSGILVFSEEVDTVYVRVGDSLRWARTSDFYQVEMPPIVFRDAGGCSASASLSALFPAVAALIGTEAQISESIGFEGSRDLSTADDLDWIHVNEGYYTVNLTHSLPFALDELSLGLFNTLDEPLGNTTISAVGGLLAGQNYSTTLPVTGLVTQANTLTISGASLPMDAPALIQDGAVQLELLLSYCEADSARAIVQEQHVTHLDSLMGDSRMNLTRALADSLEVEFITTNGLGVPVELDLVFENLCHDSLCAERLSLNQMLLPDETGTLAHRDTLWITLEEAEDDELQYLNFELVARVPETSEFATLRAGDAISLELAVDHARLRLLEGEYRQDQTIEVESGLREFDELPPELIELDMRDLDLLVGLDSDLHSDVNFNLELDVYGRDAADDTTYQIFTLLPGGAQTLTVPRLGRVLSRLPNALFVGGNVTIPAGQPFALRDTSEVGILSFQLPLELQLNSLIWSSEPEQSDDTIEDEMYDLSAACWVRNRVPVGGDITAWLSPSGVLGGSDAVELFHLAVSPAGWEDGFVVEVQDTLNFELSDEAVDVLRGDTWFSWFHFEASSQDETVQLREDQWLILQLLLRLEYEVELQEED